MSDNGLKPGSYLKGGRYRIEKVLGQGSFGITYLATTRIKTEGNLGTMEVEAKVAIKEFFMSDVNSRGEDGSTITGSGGNVFTNYRHKFKREAETLSKLKHKNIVSVFDIFDENSTTYYAMEFLEGGTLDDYITSKGKLSEAETIAITREIGDALAYMHREKMLHLDIKPRNMMRTRDGRYFLIDFGLSKQFNDGGEPESSTSIGLGTPGYSPIEQASYQKEGEFPATLDIYALGASMYKMLTGKRPPQATTILNEGFPERELLEAGISRETTEVLKKAMAPIKKERYASVEDLLYDLEDEKTLIGPPVSPKEPTVENPPETEDEPVVELLATPVARKRRTSLILWIILSVVAVGVAALGYVYWTNSNEQVETSEKSPKAELSENKTGSQPEPEPTASTPSEAPVSKVIANVTLVSPLPDHGEMDYSGDVIWELQNGEYVPVPHGQGTARILTGNFKGAVYKGAFDHGNMNGKGEYTLKSGDIIVGTFKSNEIEEGMYIFDDMYYKGTFRNMEPYNGYWYDVTDKVIGRVVKGETKP